LEDQQKLGLCQLQELGRTHRRYVGLLKKLHPLTGDGGLCAAVYTRHRLWKLRSTACSLTTGDGEDDQAPSPQPPRSFTRRRNRDASEGTALIPPATPLVACDPYFSIWSQGDKLTDVDTTHWTGKPHRLTSMVRIDGRRIASWIQPHRRTAT